MRGCRLRLCAPHVSVQAFVDRMAHKQHHAIILGDDLADFPFMTVTEFGFGRMRPISLKSVSLTSGGRLTM